MQSPLESYLREINVTPLLTADEEKSLARRIGAGDAGARDHMIRANLRLVVNISRSYTNRGLPLPDLIEEGNLGLMRAVEGFDPEMGTRFSTYASYWIKQSVKRALVNTAKTVRVPAYMVELLGKWRKMSAHLTDTLGRTATPEEIAKALEIPKRKLEIVKKAIALYQTNPGGAGEEGWSLGEMLTDEKTPAPDADLTESDSIRRALDLLDDLDRAGEDDPRTPVRPDRRGTEDAQGDRRRARPDPRTGPPDRDRRPPPPEPQPRRLNVSYTPTADGPAPREPARLSFDQSVRRNRTAVTANVRRPVRQTHGRRHCVRATRPRRCSSSRSVRSTLAGWTPWKTLPRSRFRQDAGGGLIPGQPRQAGAGRLGEQVRHQQADAARPEAVRQPPQVPGPHCRGEGRQPRVGPADAAGDAVDQLRHQAERPRHVRRAAQVPGQRRVRDGGEQRRVAGPGVGKREQVDAAVRLDPRVVAEPLFPDALGEALGVEIDEPDAGERRDQGRQVDIAGPADAQEREGRPDRRVDPAQQFGRHPPAVIRGLGAGAAGRRCANAGGPATRHRWGPFGRFDPFDPL